MQWFVHYLPLGFVICTSAVRLMYANTANEMDFMCNLMRFVSGTIAPFFPSSENEIGILYLFWGGGLYPYEKPKIAPSHYFLYWCQHIVNGWALLSFVISFGMASAKCLNWIHDCRFRRARQKMRNSIQCLSPATRYKSCAHNEAIRSFGFNMPDLWIPEWH